MAASANPRVEGDALVQRLDYTGAAARYREALQREPDDLLLRFAYGSVLSHLDRRDDAIEQFAWVVAHGDPARPEVATARRWLREAGAVIERPAVAQTPDQADESSERGAEGPGPVAAAGEGVVKGRSEWPGVGPNGRRMSLSLRLRGEGAPTDARMRLHVEMGGPFTMSKIPAGRYRLTGQSAGVVLWDVPVTVEPAKTATLELSPANSTVPASQFPPPS